MEPVIRTTSNSKTCSHFTVGLFLQGHMGCHLCSSSQNPVLGSWCVTSCWITPDMDPAMNNTCLQLSSCPQAQEAAEEVHGPCHQDCVTEAMLVYTPVKPLPRGMELVGKWGAIYSIVLEKGKWETNKTSLCLNHTTMHSFWVFTYQTWKTSKDF
jgi:hypothetical protein